jgi:hypothetical protein
MKNDMKVEIKEEIDKLIDVKMMNLKVSPKPDKIISLNNNKDKPFSSKGMDQRGVEKINHTDTKWGNFSRHIDVDGDVHISDDQVRKIARVCYDKMNMSIKEIIISWLPFSKELKKQRKTRSDFKKVFKG